MRASHFGKQMTQLASSLVLALLCGQTFAQPPDIDRIVAFGASLSDSGNSFVWLAEPENSDCGTRLIVPPYDALDDLLVPDGAYAKGGHHFTNGATWVEGLARHLALAGNTRPAFRNGGKKASNYAVGGARAVAGFPCRFNLPAQVNTYLGDFGSTSSRTLVAIEIGGNDVRDALVAALTPGGDPAQKIQDALTSLFQSINRLYGSGAVNFLVLNVPDIGQSPAVRAIDQANGAGGAIIALAGSLTDAYNANLAALVNNLGAYPGIDIKILDVHRTLDDVLASPEDYGFANASDPCISPMQPPYQCESPDQFVFWDGTHPTRAMHAIVAQQAIAAISAP